MSYKPDETLPALVDQPMQNGVWKAGNPMCWVSEDDAPPQGPLLPQEHDEGMWVPGPGGLMTWASADPEVEEVVPIEIVPGDEPQPEQGDE